MSFHFYDLIDHIHRQIEGRGPVVIKKKIKPKEIEIISEPESDIEESDIEESNIEESDMEESDMEESDIEDIGPETIFRKEIKRLGELKEQMDENGEDTEDIEAEIKDLTDTMTEKLLEEAETEDPEWIEIRDESKDSEGRIDAKEMGNIMEASILNNKKLLNYIGEPDMGNSKDKNNPYWTDEFRAFIDTKPNNFLSFFPIDAVGKDYMEVKTLQKTMDQFKTKEGDHPASNGVHIGGTKFSTNAEKFNPIFTKNEKTGDIQYTLFYKKKEDGNEYTGKVSKSGTTDLKFLVSLEDGKYETNLSKHPELWTLRTTEEYEDEIMFDDLGNPILDEEGEPKTEEKLITKYHDDYVLNYYDEENNPYGTVGKDVFGHARIGTRYWRRIPNKYSNK